MVKAVSRWHRGLRAALCRLRTVSANSRTALRAPSSGTANLTIAATSVLGAGTMPCGCGQHRKRCTRPLNPAHAPTPCCPSHGRKRFGNEPTHCTEIAKATSCTCTARATTPRAPIDNDFESHGRGHFDSHGHKLCMYSASDHCVRSVATTSSSGPASPATPASAPSAPPPSAAATSSVSDAIWHAVFHFPHPLTATADRASGPSAAAHSRSADMVISRPVIAAAHTGTSHVFPASGPAAIGAVHRSNSTVDTMSLSATGSKNAPNADDSFCARAREAQEARER
eukprot:352476-Chlamydomonas_euryale.AAC.6